MDSLHCFSSLHLRSSYLFIVLSDIQVLAFQRFNVLAFQRFIVLGFQRFSVLGFQRFNVLTFQRFIVLGLWQNAFIPPPKFKLSSPILHFQFSILNSQLSPNSPFSIFNSQLFPQFSIFNFQFSILNYRPNSPFSIWHVTPLSIHLWINQHSGVLSAFGNFITR